MLPIKPPDPSSNELWKRESGAQIDLVTHHYTAPKKRNMRYDPGNITYCTT